MSLTLCLWQPRVAATIIMHPSVELPAGRSGRDQMFVNITGQSLVETFPIGFEVFPDIQN